MNKYTKTVSSLYDLTRQESGIVIYDDETALVVNWRHVDY